MTGATFGDALFGLQDHGLGLFYLLALSSVRLLVVFTILPATSEDAVTGTVRNGIVLMFALFVAYGQPADALASADMLRLVMLTAKEAFVGALIGYAASSIFWIAEGVGTIVDDMAGYNSVQMNNPMHGEQSTPVANTLMQLAITLFYVLGGMIVLLGAIYESYRWWPLVQAAPDVGGIAESFLLKRTDSMMNAITKLAAPIMLILALIELGFGYMSRTADKLEPSNLSQPVRGALALLLLALLAQAFVAHVKTELAFVHFDTVLRGDTSRDGTRGER
ncbi:type III secretion system protein [Burkholderia cepacia]|uniref:Type III secretion system protein n=1 Tax=Burkholderia cepacia TaxID=292 RepID=A0A103ZA87_BURCE|nr:type III secretion system export apparatus subunit SctT [Burkholderia cepacia]KVK75951.1 type III secretion system protein [Burkholderia cepacia]